MKLARNSLCGRRNNDGTLSIVCDDCKFTLTFDLETRDRRQFAIGAPEALRPWSITKRKQRCPDCTVKAREKGWVK